MRSFIRFLIALSVIPVLGFTCSPTSTLPCTEQGIRDAIALGGGPHHIACFGATVVTQKEIVIDNDVILDGENMVVDGNDDHRVFSVAEGVAAELRRMTITGAKPRFNGAGVYNEGTLTLMDSTVSGNFGDSAVYNEGTLTLMNSTVSDNLGVGAAVDNEGTATLTNSTVSGNRYLRGIGNGNLGTLTLINSTVSGNGGGPSGGIFNAGTLTVMNSAVSGNTAGYSGGGVYNWGTLTLTNSTVSGNTAVDFGGGIFNEGTLTLMNSTISGNTGREGGGIHNYADFPLHATLVLTNSTVSGNTAERGGGISNIDTLTVANSLIDGECAGPIASSGHNIESPGHTCGFDQATDQDDVSADDLNLGPLADNGGATMTHALLTEPTVSVAIDAIPAEDCVDADGAPLTIDQRGEPRPEAGGTMCDVGAFELRGGGGTTGQEFPCTEQGIRDAIAEGNGTHTFDCDGPTTVVTDAEIVIDNDVILDGEGNLTVDGSALGISSVFRVGRDVTTELRRLKTTNGWHSVVNQGTLTFIGSVISNHSNCALINEPEATMTLVDTTVSDNRCGDDVGNQNGGAITNEGFLTLMNTTVSGNTGDTVGGIHNVYFGIVGIGGTADLINSTVSGNSGGDILNEGTIVATGSVVNGRCLLVHPYNSRTTRPIASLGHNIESPGNTCGFDPDGTDLVNVTAGQLNLGPLQDNGGPTMTHALLTEPTPSVAIDAIPEEDCVDADGQPLTTDQRGVSRPQGTACDVGAFELQP